MNDLKFAIRQLCKNAGSTAMAVLILALGIGGATAVFSVVDRVILNPVPGINAKRLVHIQEVEVLKSMRAGVSPPVFVELCSYTNIFAALSAYQQGAKPLPLNNGAFPVKLRMHRTTPGFFELFGARPLIGRTFLPDEGGRGRQDVIVLTHATWKQHFGGDPAIVGRTITLDGSPFTVIGIMPSSFQFPYGEEWVHFWLPHSFSAEEQRRVARHWDVIGLLREGVSLAQAKALLDSVSQRLEKDYPEPNKKWIIAATPLRSKLVGPTLERTLWSLQAAVTMVLLIACANVGTLLLSRAVARRGEFSIRMAMGAGRLRIVRQLATESLVLAGVAGLCGLFCAWAGIRILDHLYLGNLPRLRTVSLDGSVLALTAVVSTTAGVIFSIIPSWTISHLRLSESLKETARQQSGGSVQRLLHDALVVIQVALAVVLLTGAGLMIQSTVRLLSVDPGLNPKGLYRVRYDVPTVLQRFDLEQAMKGGLSRSESINKYFAEEIERQLRWHELLIENATAVPGIDAVTVAPNTGGRQGWADYRIEARDELLRLSPSYIGVRAGDYFRTLQLPLISGRLLTRDDAFIGQQAVIINEELARQCWPSQNPLGKRIFSTGYLAGEDFVVVGVVKEMRDWQKDTPQWPTLYCPAERITKSGGALGGAFMLRSDLAPDILRRTLATLGREMSPSVEIGDFYSVETRLYESTAPRRVYMWLLNTMGGLGLLLSALGIYAVMAYAVVRRTKEIGVRMALGAAKDDVAKLVLHHGGRLVLTGIVLGLLTTFTLVHLIESLLFEVKPGDPWSLVGVIVTLGGVAGIACYMPARRAARIDPVVALRCE